MSEPIKEQMELRSQMLRLMVENQKLKHRIIVLERELHTAQYYNRRGMDALIGAEKEHWELTQQIQQLRQQLKDTPTTMTFNVMPGESEDSNLFFQAAYKIQESPELWEPVLYYFGNFTGSPDNAKDVLMAATSGLAIWVYEPDIAGNYVEGLPDSAFLSIARQLVGVYWFSNKEEYNTARTELRWEAWEKYGSGFQDEYERWAKNFNAKCDETFKRVRRRINKLNGVP